MYWEEQVDREYELIEMCPQTNSSVITTTGVAKKTLYLPSTPKPRPTKQLALAPPTGRYMGVAKEEDEEESPYCIPVVQ